MPAIVIPRRSSALISANGGPSTIGPRRMSNSSSLISSYPTASASIAMMRE